MSNTINLQEIAQAFANSMATALNSIVTETVGMEIMYFKAVPVEEQTDFLFHDYTLYNVEPCPMEFKAIYTNTSYDESNYVFSQLGMDYQSPLELEIDISTWINVTSNSGDEPRAGDIVYIPQTNKLLEVSSMNPGKTAGQVTSYKISCKKYQPSKHRYTGEALTTAIENNTVNTNSLYGEKINGMVQDLVNDEQTTMNTIESTTDNYREIAKTADSDSNSVLNSSKVNCIKDFENNFSVDGHLVAKYYYDNNISEDIVVKYKKEDAYTADDVRSLSVWFNIQAPSSNKYKVSSIEILGRDKKNTKVKFVSNYDFDGKYVNIERGSIRMFGTLEDNILLIPNSTIAKLPTGWNELSGFSIYETKSNNLLTVEGDNNLSFDINGNRYLTVTSDSGYYNIDLGKTLDYDHWYALIINISSTVNCFLFDSDPNLRLLKESKGTIKWESNSVEDYCIKSSNMYMTNIRLYNKANSNLSYQLQDLVTYIIPNASNAVIDDSADKYLDYKYYCMPS